MRAADERMDSDHREAEPAPCVGSDAGLVERAKTDPQAFGELYESYYSRMLNYIYRRTLDLALSEELTSNTFFKAIRGLKKYRNRGSFRGWLYRIATNEIRMHWRSRRTHRENDPRWKEELHRIYFTARQSETPEEIVERMRQFVLLHESLRRLPQRYHTVLVLRYFEGLPLGEIAKVLDKRIGTVKSLVHRGLKRLRDQITGDNATFSAHVHPLKREEVKIHEEHK
jgi:RNA polymerase sigma-70 factor (ECF subfamily)